MENSNKLFEFNKLYLKELYEIGVGKIFQVSELSLAAGGEIDEHVQICDEITYVVSGSATFYINGEAVVLKHGQICYLRKNSTHKIEVGMNRDFRYLCIGIVLNEENEYTKSFISGMKNMNWFVKNDTGNMRIILEMFINEFYMPDCRTDAMINLYASIVFLMLKRMLEENSNEKHQNTVTVYAQHMIYNILRYIDREYMNIKSVDDIAKRFSYSEYYISHLFRQKVGISIKQYVILKKMERAAELLKKTDISITDISESMNYYSPHTFSRAFKKIYSVPPTVYRKENGNL